MDRQTTNRLGLLLLSDAGAVLGAWVWSFTLVVHEGEGRAIPVPTAVKEDAFR